MTGHHFDGSHRTVAGTVAALHIIGQYHTVLLDPYGMANLRGDFVFVLDRLDGTSRTDLRTAVAFGSAIAQLVTHDGLHQVHQVAGGTQHLIGTLRDTQLTARTVMSHVLSRQRAGRRQRCLALGGYLVLNLGQSAVHHLFFLLGQCGSGEHSRR